MSESLINILNKYSPETAEVALVQIFIEKNKISVKRNRLIKSMLGDRRPEVFALRDALLLKKIELFDVIDFVNLFELLVPERDKRLNGAFFTPKQITDFIASEAITTPDTILCDPSCGCGAFLVASTLHIKKRYDKKIVNIIENNLYGVDIAAYSVQRAKILLTLVALVNDEDPEEIRFNILEADSLSVNWENLFPEVFHGQKKGFDLVIGNPPYVKFQDLNKTQRDRLFKDWKTLNIGNYNLYFAFFELGIQLINDNGSLAYITPNNFFTSLAGKSLREHLQSNRFINKIIDFYNLKVFKAQVYTCIAFLTKRGQDYFLYNRVSSASQISSLQKLKYSKIYFNKLDPKKWRLLNKADQVNIEIIEKAGTRLGDLTDIRVGIATCKDAIYFLDGSNFSNGFYYKSYQNKEYPIEERITRRVARVSDFKDQTSLNRNSRRIIFPYQDHDGSVELIPEKELEANYPRCYSYLNAVKNDLQKRDKGAANYQEWYAYARSQGLTFTGKKLLTPTFSSEPRFLLEDDEKALFCNGYAIYLKEIQNLFSATGANLDLDTISKILNSRIMAYYIENTSVSIQGGYPCYQKNFIESFGIPKLDVSEIRYIQSETDKALLDSFLCEKYGISI
jgi:tRNA1(Val) A37 N6-methylase TrmN6